MSQKIKVLIVDDSSVVRQVLSEILSEDSQLEVVGTACDPFVARDRIKQLQPDVITLDVEMPRMDGITFLSNLMRLRPMPVVMISSLTEKGADTTMKALELGAVDFMPKPQQNVAEGLRDYALELRSKVRAAARARVAPRHASEPEGPAIHKVPRTIRSSSRVLAVGASTGGVEALGRVFVAMPPDGPGMVVVQHIPNPFAEAFARRIDMRCQRKVLVAQDGAPVLDGHIFIAPGDEHLEIVSEGAGYRMRLSSAPKVSGHRPSVDVLFHSVARVAGKRAAAALLTGMGSDGAAGLLELRQAGAWTLAQDEASSVVWGMPREAVKIGAACAVVPLDQVAPALTDWAFKAPASSR